ncbi:cytidine deaminase [Acinetobacter boissieri]|uniref:Cytidine deaminase n=1 Tax=Acinetobacter boissieri TaxID=1219383 RepID=A0A1G6JKC6_9GAMM|nr:cytidine deaminase [Acinetobacter boissieri]SDC19137.1 cytidine deaminase [Acinetobacter boissieri]
MQQKLLQTALDFMSLRYPQGSGGVAVLATESGKILTSIAPDVKNDALSVCMEMGACLEAHKINEKVTHSLCIYRESEHSQILFLTPCGICQERLAHWGGHVQVAVSTSDNILLFKPLRELMPYHWSIVNGDIL